MFGRSYFVRALDYYSFFLILECFLTVTLTLEKEKKTVHLRIFVCVFMCIKLSNKHKVRHKNIFFMASKLQDIFPKCRKYLNFEKNMLKRGEEQIWIKIMLNLQNFSEILYIWQKFLIDRPGSLRLSVREWQLLQCVIVQS